MARRRLPIPPAPGVMLCRAPGGGKGAWEVTDAAAEMAFPGLRDSVGVKTGRESADGAAVRHPAARSHLLIRPSPGILSPGG